jgi:L-asparaginase
MPMAIVMFTRGGTIAMSGRDGGVVARLGGKDLVAGITGLADVEIRDLPAVPSAQLSFADVLDVVDAAAVAVDAGADGIVLTQGTDTMEETAYLIDLVWDRETPFVVTGAMRNPTMEGADGPANVAAAIATAKAAEARGRGALVVFNDEIHAARWVRKAHSTSTATFISPDLGPIGHVVERVPRFLAMLPRTKSVSGFTRTMIAATRVALYTTTLDDDGLLLQMGADSLDGLVVAAFGVGHTSAELAVILGDIASEIPVVLTSRTGAGSVLANTYGATGSERDLLSRGLINGGMLHPYKARILLRLMVAADASRREIATSFAAA